MDWLELSVFTTDEGLDAVCARLDMLGISQVVVREGTEGVKKYLERDAKYWDFADVYELAAQEPCVQAYLPYGDESLELAKQVAGSFEQLRQQDIGVPLGSLRVAAVPVEEQDWANNWKAYYKPIQIGKKLLVCPSWEPVANAGERVVLKLDPGMAFGSGSHHTTRMCLELLQDNVRPGMQILDVGCGSGILFIAGLLLGAKHAVAVDVDGIALQVTGQNCELNGIDTARYRVLIGDMLAGGAQVKEAFESSYELVTANIVAGVIISLTKVVAPLLAKGGVFIASGIICERLDEVKAAIESAGFKLAEERVQEGWAAIAAIKE